jgi:hypothetical protein
MDTVTISLNQQQMDVLTDLIDRAIKNPVSGGLQALDGATMILNLLRTSVMHKQIAAAAEEQAAPNPPASPVS